MTNDEGPSLREAVEAQARARTSGDMAAFASYMTPRALLQLRQSPPETRTRPRRFAVVDVTETASEGASEVRYSGGASFVLRERWERIDGLWTVVSAECPSESVRPPVWRRLRALFFRPAPEPERKELE